MNDTVNKTIEEKKIEKATIKAYTKFLMYTPVVMYHLNDDTEGKL